MAWCDYKGCTNKNTSGISRFSIPYDYRRATWLVNSGNSFSNKQMYICSDHFDRTFLNKSTFCPRLSSVAFPFSYKQNSYMCVEKSESALDHTKITNKDIKNGLEIKFTNGPKAFNSPLATTSFKAIDQKDLLKNVDMKETPIPTKETEENSLNRAYINEETKSNCSDTEESVTVLQIIEDNEEFHVKKDENDSPTVKRRKFNGQAAYIANALQCMKTHIKKNTKIDEYSIFGQLIAQEIRTCNRSHRDISIAQHHIENVIFNLTMGVYNKVQLPPLASQDKINSTIPSNITLVIPKSEPE